jgi:hypothetical protein
MLRRFRKKQQQEKEPKRGRSIFKGVGVGAGIGGGLGALSGIGMAPQIYNIQSQNNRLGDILDGKVQGRPTDYKLFKDLPRGQKIIHRIAGGLGGGIGGAMSIPLLGAGALGGYLAYRRNKKKYGKK